MTIAIILAGGSGLRLLSSKIPKQFIEIEKKPIIVHTIEKFLINKNIDKIVIPCNLEWKQFLLDSIKNINTHKNIYICDGGNSRNDSIKQAVSYIKKSFAIKPNDIILTHDAVRVFIASKLINENIKKITSFDCVDTIINSTDTIVVSQNKNTISEIPDRDMMFLGQTPQTFKYYVLEDIYLNSTFDETIFNKSDACKLAFIKNYKIGCVLGEPLNFKLTNDFDLEMVKLILNNDKH